MVTKRGTNEGQENGQEGDPQTDLPVSPQENHESFVTYRGSVRRLFTAHGRNLWVEPGDKIPKGVFEHPELEAK
jgi:hypothetical protein